MSRASLLRARCIPSPRPGEGADRVRRPSCGRISLRRSAPALTAFLTLLLLLPALALDFPALTGRVVDDANILDPQARAVLTDKLAALETKTSDQLVVVTLKSLQGTSVEDFGVELGRHWQIGQKGKNNGVLLIVAPNERKVRIEVGYGLEGALTDAVSRLIIENAITPRFRAGDFPGGITRGVDDIISVLTGDAAEWRACGQAAGADDALGFAPGHGARCCGFWICIPHARRHHPAKPRSRQIARRLVERLVLRVGLDWSSGSPGGFSDGGGFSGGGGSFGGGGSSGSW